MFKQDSLENISKMLYGNKYNKKEENNNSFLNQSKDNNSNNYKIKPIKDSTPQELLYGAKKQENKNKEDKKTNPTNTKPIKDSTPQELLYGVKDKGKERKNIFKETFNNLKNKVNELTGYQEEDIEPFKLHVEYNDYKNEEKNKANDNDFEEFLKEIFVTEGGFSDKKADKGGRTNYGITQKTYDWYNQRHKIEKKDVKNITKEEAKKIYYNDYWIASGANKIKDKDLAYMHFDAAVNHGVGNAKKFLKLSNGDFDKYYELRKQMYDDIVKNEKEQKQFYNGWSNRINKIKDKKASH